MTFPGEGVIQPGLFAEQAHLEYTAVAYITPTFLERENSSLALLHISAEHCSHLCVPCTAPEHTIIRLLWVEGTF